MPLWLKIQLLVLSAWFTYSVVQVTRVHAPLLAAERAGRAGTSMVRR